METNSKTQSPIAWVLGQTGAHGGQYLLSVILAIFGVAFSIAPYFVVVGIVQGLMSDVTDFPFYLSRCLLMAAFWLGRVLCHAFSTATSHRATFTVLGEIRKCCMEKLTRMPLGAVLEQSSGALKNTLIERIDSIETTLAHIVPEFTANLLIPIVIVIYIFTIDWRMGLASIATVPLGMFCYVFMMAGSAKFYQKTVTSTKALNDTAVEYIGGIQVIKVFGKTKSSYDRFVHDAYEAAHSFIDWMQASIIPFTFAMVIMPATMVSVLPIGGLQAIFEALKIPAIACMVRALLRGNIEIADILMALGIMLLSIIGSGLIKAKATMLQTEAGYGTCALKRVEIAEHMRYLPMGFFNENSLGQITSVTTNVMENLENVATRVVMLVCEGLLTTSFIIVMLVFFDWRIALVLLIGFMMFLFANSFLQKAAEPLAVLKINADEKLVEKVLEYLQGMTEVKAYHLTGQKSRELNDAIAANVKVNTDMEMTLIPRMTVQSFIAKLTGVCMVFATCAFYCKGTMDALVAVVMVISAFIVYASLETAGNYSALLRVVDVSVQRAQEILDTPQMDIAGDVIRPERTDISADGIEFSYDKRKVIDGITLEIPKFLCSQNKMEMFVTAWIGILELSTGRMKCASAGHEYPAICHNGKFELLKDRHGLVLGGMEFVRYTDYEIQLDKGDKIFIYTDGVPEATDKDNNLFGTDRMVDALNNNPKAGPEEVLKNVRAAVDRFVGIAEQFDDLTMLCLEYKGGAHGHNAEK